MKTGRPSKEAVAVRRQKARLFMCVSMIASEQGVTRLAEKLEVSEGVVRADLEAIREEIENGPSEELTEDLSKTIEAADTFRQLKTLGKRVMLEMVKGTIDRALGSALVEAIREQRQVLIKARDEDTEAAITALEILTPQEQEVLRKYRESRTPPALKPGEFPAPPEGAVLPQPVPASPAPPPQSLASPGVSESQKSVGHDVPEENGQEDDGHEDDFYGGAPVRWTGRS